YGEPLVTRKHFPKKNYNRQRKLTFHPAGTGTYIIKCLAYDHNKKSVSTSRSFKVIDDTPKFQARHLILKADKTGYRVGETAKLLIQAPVKTRAVVTFEREHIVHARTVTIDGPVTVPFVIKKKHWPGFKIRVTAISGQKPIHNEIHLFVKSKSPRLDVKINTAKELGPNTEGKIILQVTSAGGKKTAAKLQVYCVDEGSLSLSAYRTPAPVDDLFYCTNWGWNYNSYATFFSPDNQRKFYLYPPQPDGQSRGCFPGGQVLKPDGSPLAGVKITIGEMGDGIVAAGETSRDGGFGFARDTRTARWVKFEKPGYVTVIHRALF
ncbi:MAG: hypothetical protein GY765_22100, partial [bacterium]|nr:hypothetical protein [bacterium]